MKDIIRKIGRKSRIVNLSDKMKDLKNYLIESQNEYKEFEETTTICIINRIRKVEDEGKKKTWLIIPIICGIVSILVLIASFLIHK